jgi:hypothetical protein
MVRPIEFTERMEFVPGLYDLDFKIYTADGTCIYNIKAYEQTVGLYAAEVILGQEYAGEQAVLRWTSTIGSVDLKVMVTLTPEEVSPDVVDLFEN